MSDEIKAVVEAAIGAWVFPGAVVGYATQNSRQILPFGRLTYDKTAGEVTKDTIYDLASVTKAIPTNSIILSLIENDRLSAEDQLVKFIPEMANSYRDKILIKHLMTFTMLLNLPQGLKTYAAAGASAILKAIYQTPLSYPPGERYHYSNAPLILLGMVAERICRQPLDVIADELFFKPLNMTGTGFHPEKFDQSTVAPTEINDRGEVRGRVHDETAWALYQAGIISGHAGVFSTAGDLLTFGQMLLGGGEYKGRRYFRPDTIEKMSTEIVNSGKFGMSLGWEMNHSAYMSPRLSNRAFGKEGFTGTMILIEPEKQKCLVILSNRTYPKRPENPAQINKVRQKLEEIILG